MKKLTRSIAELEQDIERKRQAVDLQLQYTKSVITHKLSSPPVFLIAFVTGGLLGKKFKRKLKNRPKDAIRTSRQKLSMVQKLFALSSEISVAINLYNRIKNLSANFTKKPGEIRVSA